MSNEEVQGLENNSEPVQESTNQENVQEQTQSESTAEETKTESTTPEDNKKSSDENQPPQPPEGSRRFNQIYGQLKHQENQNKELMKYNQEIFKKLESKVDNMTKLQENQFASNKEKEFQNQIVQASEDNDSQKVAQLTGDYAKHLAGINTPKEKEVVEPTSSPEKDPIQQQEFEAFKQYNPWYKTDENMTNKSHEINNEMLKDTLWNTKTNSQFLAEVARRTSQHFENTKNPYVDSVLSDGISDTGTPQKSEVALTEAEKSVAINLFHRPIASIGQKVVSKSDAIKMYADQKEKIGE